MSENPKFDEAIKDMLGDAVEYLRCPECKSRRTVLATYKNGDQYVECIGCNQVIKDV